MSNRNLLKELAAIQCQAISLENAAQSLRERINKATAMIDGNSTIHAKKKVGISIDQSNKLVNDFRSKMLKKEIKCQKG